MPTQLPRLLVVKSERSQHFLNLFTLPLWSISCREGKSTARQHYQHWLWCLSEIGKFSVHLAVRTFEKLRNTSGSRTTIQVWPWGSAMSLKTHMKPLLPWFWTPQVFRFEEAANIFLPISEIGRCNFFASIDFWLSSIWIFLASSVITASLFVPISPWFC